MTGLFFYSYFVLVPGLCLLPTAHCDLLILGFDLSNDLLHVQTAPVVHLDHHRRVLDAGLELTQLLGLETRDGGEQSSLMKTRWDSKRFCRSCLQSLISFISSASGYKFRLIYVTKNLSARTRQTYFLKSRFELQFHCMTASVSRKNLKCR